MFRLRMAARMIYRRIILRAGTPTLRRRARTACMVSATSRPAVRTARLTVSNKSQSFEFRSGQVVTGEKGVTAPAVDFFISLFKVGGRGRRKSEKGDTKYFCGVASSACAANVFLQNRFHETLLPIRVLLFPDH